MILLELHVIRQLPTMGISESECGSESKRIRKILIKDNVIGVLVLNSEFSLTVDKVIRMQRIFGSIWGERVEIIY